MAKNPVSQAPQCRIRQPRKPPGTAMVYEVHSHSEGQGQNEEPTKEEIIACAIYIAAHGYNPQEAETAINDVLNTINDY